MKLVIAGIVLGWCVGFVAGNISGVKKERDRIYSMCVAKNGHLVYTELVFKCEGAIYK